MPATIGLMPAIAATFFRGLFDDASLFPPAGLAMADAVTGHVRHRTAWYREMCGPFVCPDSKLAELSTALTAANVAELDLALVLPGGADGLDPAVDAVFADPRLRLRAVELPAGAADDPAAAVLQVATALDRTPLAGATAFIEVPVGQVTAALAHAAADRRYPIKLRTGGTTSATFPDERTLAGALVALAEQRVPFKCTAGLHHAIRHRAADTGFEHHGFLNVLLAVAAALAGQDAGEVASELADTDAGRVAAGVGRLDDDVAAGVREVFTSFGTCSTDEPVTDLVTLGLVTPG
jgi:hypothetical protein